MAATGGGALSGGKSPALVEVGQEERGREQSKDDDEEQEEKEQE